VTTFAAYAILAFSKPLSLAIPLCVGAMSTVLALVAATAGEETASSV